MTSDAPRHWLLKHLYKPSNLHGYVSYKGLFERAKLHAISIMKDEGNIDISERLHGNGIN
jgi:hypothetical protein